MFVDHTAGGAISTWSQLRAATSAYVYPALLMFVDHTVEQSVRP